MERVNDLISKKVVVIFTKSLCCTCHIVKALFSELGVNTNVHELDEEPQGREVQIALSMLVNKSNPMIPVVFTEGMMIGSNNRVMPLHLRGQLVELLKDAGALWLAHLHSNDAFLKWANWVVSHE